MIPIKRVIRQLNTWSEKFADKVSDWFGHPLFLVANIVFWFTWILMDFEPFPYGELTMMLSMQAIIMSILILNSSTRKGHEDTKLMHKDLDISKIMQDDLDEMHTDIDDIRDDIEDIKSMLENDHE